MHSAHDPLPILSLIAGLPVLCVGDVMLDRFVRGEAERISPEAPVPVLRATHMASMAGGAGNVAANLAALGCAARLVAVAGQDEARLSLDEALKEAGVQASLVTDPARPTTLKTRYSAGHQQVLRVDVEETAPLAADVEAALIDTALDALKNCRALLLSDYGKGVLTPAVLSALIRAAKEAGIPVVVDPKGRDYSRYAGADVITPNRKELGEATGGLPTATDVEVEDAARALLTRAGVGAVLATRSADGMSVVEQDRPPAHLQTRVREVFDVSGAGDTVVAVTAAALGAGAALVEAATLANIAAGLVVEKPGTATVRPDELRSAAEHTGGSGLTMAPVLPWEAARAQVERWKARGLRVGFTNGCFDIVHQGHVVMLDKCRAACDRLVLGLNADSSVARLKGPARPVNAQAARAHVVAALGSVDAVVIFGEDRAEGDTPLNLITLLRPDVIFKGKDYTPDRVVGADVVRSYGGRVELIDLEDGFSTTGTIASLKSRQG